MLDINDAWESYGTGSPKFVSHTPYKVEWIVLRQPGRNENVEVNSSPFCDCDDTNREFV